MATDIAKAISANPIKNGTAVVLGTKGDPLNNNVLNTAVLNTPTITDIESKYDTMFNEVGYYV